MARLKRTRQVAEDGDSDVEEPASARSMVPDDSRKRARISGVDSRIGSTNAQSDEIEEDEDSSEEIGYARRRDAYRLDLEEEEMDTLRATQLIQERNSKIIENTPAENGIIESVTCINFMCHNKLHVTFGPLINFIIGHNGSGKSAVLAAITLCLGGKATSTNRGGSLKNFIKNGQENAVLIIKLKNGGYGYQQEVYGPSIIVERHFSTSGSSGFKLKSTSGRVISTKKADLEEICDYFALQIDNPMNVLTQDMSRQFLNNSTPAEKYRFFVKGVQLEQLDQDYQLLEDTIDQIESKLKLRDEDIQVLENRAKKAMAKLEMSDRNNSLRGKINHLSAQMAWSQVVQEEKKIDALDVQLQDLILSIEEAELKASTVDQAYDDANSVYERGVQAIVDVKASLPPLTEKKTHLKDRFDSNKSELMQVQSEQRTIREHLNEANRKIKAYEEDISKETKRLEDLNGGDHVRRVAEIEEAKREVAEARCEYEQNSFSATKRENDVRAAEEDLARLRIPIDTKKGEVRKCEELIQSMLRDRGHHLTAFHQNMSKLLQAIQNERGFREKPVGPIGNHVRLLKHAWSPVLERSFGGTLNSFVVTSKADQVLLGNIMKREACTFPILIGNHQPIDTTNNEPDAQLDTTLRVLEIDNELVKRQLIINQAIEQTILIENRSEAQRTMYEGPRPRNVKQCFSFNDYKKGWGHRLGYRGNDESIAPMQPPEWKPRMKTDVESQINYQREILNDLKRELRDLEGDWERLQQNVQACKQALQAHKREHKELQVRLQRAEETVERLQDELERDTAQDGRLQALEGFLREAIDQKSIDEGTFENSVESKDRLNAISKELKEQMAVVDKEVAEIEFKIKKAEARALELSHIRQAALQEKNLTVQNLNEAKASKTHLEAKKADQARRVKEFANEAAKVSVRVDVDPGETPTSLDKKLEKLMKDLDRASRQIGGTPEQIAQEALQSAEAYETAKKQLDQLDEISQMLKFALIDRQNRWQQFRRFISARARAQFTYLLSERSFRGALKTDHVRHILDLQVEPDETKSGKGRQTKTLSGGEKSFSTICLLLSLWEAMGSPIRCLDEFDVFMDNVNREVTMKMMIHAARRSVGRQFVLITPNPMESIVMKDDLKIIKLGDPERGQTTITFGSQATQPTQANS